MAYTALVSKEKIQYGNDAQTITTLEIAEMMETEHKEILKKLEGTKTRWKCKTSRNYPGISSGEFSSQ